MVDIDLLKQAVYESRDGITIADATRPDNPLIFVNPAFERMTGYSADEVVGRNCRCLQGPQRDQAGLAVVREAIRRGEPCIVTLQNFRKDGGMFWNELSLSPMHDANGRVTHFLGIQKDVSSDKLVEFALREEKDKLEEARRRLAAESMTDPLTGLENRRSLDQRLPELLCRAAHDGRPVAVMLLDLDHFKRLNDDQGHPAGDAALRQVGDCLKQSRRRSSDLVARYGGEEFAVVAYDLPDKPAEGLAGRLVERVRALEVPHPSVEAGRLTASLGWVVAEADTDASGHAEALLEAADAALYAAKEQGRDRAVRGTAAAGSLAKAA
jgi:diguanylate cyclase (GGDEF)-like protein/PAS domain S-box-containing protein